MCQVISTAPPHPPLVECLQPAHRSSKKRRVLKRTPFRAISLLLGAKKMSYLTDIIVNYIQLRSAKCTS